MSIVSFTNFNGGVGKTTLCGLLGLELIKLGKKVLFIYTDPQANLTKTLAYGVPIPESVGQVKEFWNKTRGGNRNKH